MDLQTLAQQIKDVCEETETDFRNDYSGRGMFGRNCIGIVGTHQQCMEVIGQVIKNLSMSLSAAAIRAGEAQKPEVTDKLADVENDFDQSVSCLLGFQSDSMGHSVILYWQGIDPLPEVDEEHDGQPDELQEWHDFDPDC